MSFDTPFGASADSLQFLLDEPEPGQRWSTWPATTPTERGPRPHPDWLVTSAAAFDTELGIVKTGKEADVFLLERAIPRTGGCLLAAKRYRGADRSDFHRSHQYEEGRRHRNSRDDRAVAGKTAHGRAVSAAHWAGNEFTALCAAWDAGIPVPYPVQVSGTELLMEFVGDGRTAAPRLAQARLTPAEYSDAFAQVVAILTVFARAGFAHGDLSAYNLLFHAGRVVVIDLPQIVDLAANPSALDFLHRDVVNVCTWFARRGTSTDPEAMFAELLAQLW
ncbi:serine/threonine protein kinase [Microbacterium sp. Root61]|uniref:serine protein kinase RIO n=1 Tax=Microbacterium sp. Root61 TaxID=1736570 RepID=UPI0006F2E2B3|nr:RIO1 family regulatory kinase/ATPase [Microbacterium sp. Root61]KRA22361.1 serine/threonine protein kinase [Microbacterium sp. Root61]